jgi:hypothetical protein
MLAPPDVPREPDVHVTIGRIEVRAMPEPKPTRTEPRKGAPLSLDDYLKGRREGAR